MKIYTLTHTVIIISLIVTSSCKKKDEQTQSQSPVSITDIDGNVYKTVKIGSQIWMKENLKVKHYRNGDLIPTTTPDTLDISYELEPKYQWAYGGDENNVSTYGRLYTWYAITDSRNICPEGWHIPSKAEWEILLSNEEHGVYEVGAALKEVGTVHWDTTLHAPGKDRFGFCALPGGYHGRNGNRFSFYFLKKAGYWWTSTSDIYTSIPDPAWYKSIFNSSSEVYNYSLPKFDALSVRCIKD